MSEAYFNAHELSGVKALTFDVFGTTVDWRSTVTNTLVISATDKISSSSRSANLEPDVRRRLYEMGEKEWGVFAQEWRDSYKAFVSGFDSEKDEWRDIDTHHHLSLISLLKKWELETLYTEYEIEDLSRIWHFLDPWPDTSAGLNKLGTKFITSTLSNGNQELLKDLDEHGKLGFKKLQSSGDWKAYKPHPRVYLGAAEAMDLETREVAMVAAHLADLNAARSLGFRTIYVERRQEEDWDLESEEYRDAKAWVDLWVTEKDEGFLEIARRFGIN